MRFVKFDFHSWGCRNAFVLFAKDMMEGTERNGFPAKTRDAALKWRGLSDAEKAVCFHAVLELTSVFESSAAGL